MKNFNEREITESYINGNLTDVRMAIGNNLKKFLKVFDYMAECGDWTNSLKFKNHVTLWLNS